MRKSFEKYLGKFMEKEPKIEEIKERKATKIEEKTHKIVGGDPDEIVIVDSKRYKKESTGYTEKDFYCHPGPGWDWHTSRLKDITELTDRTEETYLELLLGDPGRALLDKPLYELVSI